MSESTRTQTQRQVAISTELGEDVLLLRRATVIEHLGRPFHMEVDLISEDGDIDFSKIVGRNATIRVDQQDNEERYFNGFVSKFIHTGGSTKAGHYRMTLVPWLWFLTRTSDCRIFQDMTAPDIIKQIFKDKGFSDMFDDALKATYTKRPYTVQYRETDFNFISRLMEEEGIYYYWEHKNGKHILVLADGPGSHEAYANYDKIPYFPPTDEDRGQEYIWEWIVEQEVQPGAYAVNDFDFTAPKQQLLAQKQIQREHAAADYEMYEYPGGYDSSGDGSAVAKVRIEEWQAQHDIIRGRGDVRGLAVGYTFTLDGFPRDSQNKEHLVTSAVYQIESDDYNSTLDGESDAPPYEVSFTAMLATTQFRARRITPKPLIHGPQTAIVTGPSGEEIHVDKYGRVKVQFHWDRYAKGDDTTSCWIRVAQFWAGKKWGAIFPPRVGQEVVVEFLDGDPDRPIIVGSVYNAVCMPPYPLPDRKSISAIKSDSYKGSGGCNEIRFEDKKEAEVFFVQAQKDQWVHIKNDRLEFVGHNRHLVVKADKFERVEASRHETVGKDHIEKIKRDRSLTVDGKQAVSIGGSKSCTVGKDVIDVFKANHSEEVTNDYYLHADNICIHGKTNITLKVGGSTIAIEEDGIQLKTSGKIEFICNGDLTSQANGATSLQAGGNMSMETKANLDAKATGNVGITGMGSTAIKGTSGLTLN